MIAQPSPNLSLTSLHFFPCSLFLSCLPMRLLFLCWKDFYFCQLLSFFFSAVFIYFASQNILYSHLFPHSVLPLLFSITSKAPLQTMDPPGEQMWVPPA